MESSREPDETLARKVLPAPLYSALAHIFAQQIAGCVLVGGTALSGFYAGHRRSDDLELFVRDEDAYAQALLAARSLKRLGSIMEEKAHSAQYYRALCTLDRHTFTVDVVLDENLFAVGRYAITPAGIAVADLPTLVMMKSAALLSRCSEKDLYDLIWLFENTESLTLSGMIEMGKRIDNGFSTETLLYSISSATLREEACDFGIGRENSSKRIYSLVSGFRDKLVSELHRYLTDNPTDDLGELIRWIRKLSRHG